MNCGSCKSKMTLLFTSYVCDVCNPPGGLQSKEVEAKYKKMWIFYDEDPRVTVKMWRDFVYPHEDPEIAILRSESSVRNNPSSKLYEVYYKPGSNPSLGEHAEKSYLLGSEEEIKFNDAVTEGLTWPL